MPPCALRVVKNGSKIFFTVRSLIPLPLSFTSTTTLPRSKRVRTTIRPRLFSGIAWLALMLLNGIAIQNIPWILLLAVIVAGLTSTSAMLSAVFLKDRERSQFVYSLMLLAAASIGTLLDISPIKTISRLGIGDVYTNGWNVALFAALLAALYLLLLKFSRRVNV